jgi:hypothetical protein
MTDIDQEECVRPSAQILLFPQRPPTAEATQVSGNDVESPSERLVRALALLKAAQAEQREAVAKWRSALSKLNDSIRGLGQSLDGLDTTLDGVKPK